MSLTMDTWDKVVCCVQQLGVLKLASLRQWLSAIANLLSKGFMPWDEISREVGARPQKEYVFPLGLS